MSGMEQPRSLRSDEIAAAAGVLARAFHDDAGIAYFLLDLKGRAAILPAFFAPMIRFARAHGEATALGDPLTAVALWLPPGVAATPDGLGDAGFDAVAATWSPEALARFGAFVAHLGSEHARLMADTPHWTLVFVGVEPGAQGHGLGSRLLRPTVERIRRDGGVCYTETLEARNVPFYARLGFRTVAESEVPDSRTHVWSLRAGELASSHVSR